MTVFNKTDCHKEHDEIIVWLLVVVSFTRGSISQFYGYNKK